MKAILSKTTTDKMRSKILSPQLSELILEVYMSPREFAEIVEKYDDKAMIITIEEDI